AHGVLSIDDPTVDLVALVWPADAVQTRRSNELLMSDAVAQTNLTAPIPVVIFDQYAVVSSAGNDEVWIVAPNLGQTLEDRLRLDDFRVRDRRLIIETLATLRRS